MPAEVKIVLTMTLFASMAYFQMDPFFPKFLKEREIDKMYLGLNMAIFATSKIITSGINGYLL